MLDGLVLTCWMISAVPALTVTNFWLTFIRAFTVTLLLAIRTQFVVSRSHAKFSMPVPCAFSFHLCALSRLRRSIELGTISYSLDRVQLCTRAYDSPRYDILFVRYCTQASMYIYRSKGITE